VSNITNRTDSIGGARAIGTQQGVTYPQHFAITPQSVDEVGGYDTLPSGSACADTDGDGMPNAFENRYGLDRTDSTDQWRDADGDGYSNLEEYLNGTQPR